MNVLEKMPFDKLWTLLNAPQEVDRETLDLMVWWMRPKFIWRDEIKIGELMIAIKAVDSFSAAMRALKQGSVKWNGKKVTDIHQLADFIKPGWGVLQIGKKNHFMALSPTE